MPASDFVLFRNIGLSAADTAAQTSNVGEPSLASNGRQIWLTGNWYASRSLDNGATWEYVSPYNALPPASGGFCCDQIVHYDRSRDLIFWLLQYVKADNTNVLRVAIKRGATLGNANWYWWDFRPELTNAAWAGEEFDYPDLEVGTDFLYLTSNVFSIETGKFTRAAILRLPLDDLAAGGNLQYRYFSTTDNFALRCTRGAREVMYFASHNSNSQLRLFNWPEAADDVTWNDIAVSQWNGGRYASTGPDHANWLARADPRITGAWLANGIIGLMWTANSRAGRPAPYVRVVRIAEQAKTVVDEPDIWNAKYAYGYPDACPNDRGHVGVSLFRGGGALNPGHVVAIWDDFSNGWQLVATANGTNGPEDTKWGDYLACRRHAPDGLSWLASGYTLQGGGSREHVVPRVVHFGRRRDERAVRRWQRA